MERRDKRHLQLGQPARAEIGEGVVDMHKIRLKISDHVLWMTEVDARGHADGGAHLVERGLGFLVGDPEYLEDLYSRVSKGADLLKHRDILTARLI